MNPTLEEVNRGIGEFMDLDVIRILPQYGDFPCFKNNERHSQIKYTESLDALHSPIQKYFRETDFLTTEDIERLDVLWGLPNPAEDLAIELYKAIRELK